MEAILNAEDIDINNLPIYDDGSLTQKAKLKSITIMVKDINKSQKFYGEYLLGILNEVQYVQSPDKASHYLVTTIKPDPEVDFTIILKQKIESLNNHFQQDDKFPVKISFEINNMENYQNVASTFQSGQFIIAGYDNNGEESTMERYTDVIDPDGNLIQLVPGSPELFDIEPIYVKQSFNKI